MSIWSLPPFIDLFHDLTNGFNKFPNEFGEVCRKLLCVRAYPLENYALPPVDEYNAIQEILSSMNSEQFTPAATITPLQFADLAVSVHKENKYIKDQFREILEEAQKTKYDQILIDVEKCRLGEVDLSYSVAFDILEITNGLHDNLIYFNEPAKKIIESIDSIIRFFSTRNIKLANDSLDYKKIRTLLKKHFAIDSCVTLIYASHLINEIINRKAVAITHAQSTYEAGHAFEKTILEAYSLLGYSVSITTASGDFGIDVIAK